jgi:hypothetical protein
LTETSVRLTVEEIIFTRWTRRQGKETNVVKRRGDECDEGKKSFKAPAASLASQKKNPIKWLNCVIVSAPKYLVEQASSGISISRKMRLMGKWKVNEIYTKRECWLIFPSALFYLHSEFVFNGEKGRIFFFHRNIIDWQHSK